MFENDIVENPGPLEKNENNVRIMSIASDTALDERLSSIASRFGCTIKLVSGDANTMEKISSFKPDIIFIDISNPNGFNKIEFCKRLKKDPATQHIQLIAFFEYRNEDIASESLGCDIDNFLTKSAADIQLIAIIHNALKSKAYSKEYEILLSLFNTIHKAKREWEESMDCLNDIIILTDLEDNIKRCNKTLCVLTGKGYKELLGRKWQEILKENGFTESKHNPDDPAHIDIVHPNGNAFHINYTFIKDVENVNYAKVVHLHDITELKNVRTDIKKSKEELEKKNKELEDTYSELKKTQAQLLQQEKMASIGQLAAGIAHEINNPICFVISNFNSFQKYTDRLIEFLKAQSIVIEKLSQHPREEALDPMLNSLMQKKESLKLDYILEDIGNLLKESMDGADRVKQIVLDLKNFSHVDEEGYKLADIHSGLDSTINIVWNELKYKTTLKKEYGDIPVTRCNLGQLNQVFMNCLLNAVQAIKEHGEIIIKTWHEMDSIYISISDTGCGIPEKDINRIFEPFFTTKEPGKGTGLGLTIAYNIIKQHKGEIRVESKVGKGTTFTIMIPVVTA